MRELEGALRRGNATEHTHRPALKALLEGLVPGIIATNEPARVECGAPDFLVSRRARHGLLTVGYVEAKDVGALLNRAERSAQLLRYRSALQNLILTDYIEFRWFVDGETRLRARLAKPKGSDKLETSPDSSRAVRELLSAFLTHVPEPIRDPKALAERMARLTHLIRDVIIADFASGKPSGMLRDLRRAFSEVLIPDLDVPAFSDMFAQTIAYGLFAARCNHKPSRPFERGAAAAEIPRANPFLRKLFATIAGPELGDERFSGFVDDLVQLLADADMPAILENFGKRTRQEDPVVHFYETFLAAYDPRLREARGVYYTPEPVVSFIIRSVDAILKDAFGCREGLSDRASLQLPEGRQSHRVLVLDPACGTGTFLYAIVDHMRNDFIERNAAGEWPAYVREHLLPRVFGFELLMAPYAVAHLKLGMQLAALDMPSKSRAAWGYDFSGEDRVGVYLTNSLEEAAKKSELLIGRYISEEANAAAAIKRDLPIMVVTGNPPYSGHSANKGEWIRDLVRDYVRGVAGLDKPAQAKWLQDDYVKFIRFAQWRIERTGSGILAFITNNRYMANPTFRGMREHLMRSFSEIYLLNLHGDSKRGERSPDGSEDENVFDIQQGVAVGLFIKSGGGAQQGRVYHADLWGHREEKYSWLSRESIRSIRWQEIQPIPPFFLFTPEKEDLRQEYDQFWPLPQAMNQNGDPAPGIVTTHDDFAISFTREEAIEKVERFLATASEDEARSIWTLCTQSQWDYGKAKEELGRGGWREQVRQILYRPFDVRWTVWNPNVAVHRRERVMRHMLDGTNIALATTRATEIGRGFEHAFCATIPIQHHTVSSKEVNYLFPLYLLPADHEVESGLFPASERRPNFSRQFLEEVERRTGLAFDSTGAAQGSTALGPKDLLGYIYAILCTPSYRERYSDLLRIDFPRVPLTRSKDLFMILAARGTRLLDLHSLTGSIDSNLCPRFPVRGTNTVVAPYPRFVEREGRVYVNATSEGPGQYFEPIPMEVWDFHVGGYRVCDRWLRDRRGRVLSFNDLASYERVVGAINESLGVITEIEAAIENRGGWPGLESEENLSRVAEGMKGYGSNRGGCN